MKHFADHISCAVLLPDYRMWLLQKLLSQTVSGSWHDRSAMRGARRHCCASMSRVVFMEECWRARSWLAAAPPPGLKVHLP
jgi:hypothetical protein